MVKCIWYILFYLINLRTLWIDLIMSTSLNHTSSLANKQCDNTAQDRKFSFNCKWQLKVSKEDCPPTPYYNWLLYFSAQASLHKTEKIPVCYRNINRRQESEVIYKIMFLYLPLNWHDWKAKIMGDIPQLNILVFI